MIKINITVKDLATILDTHKSTLYYIMHPEKKKELSDKKARKENRIPGSTKPSSGMTSHMKINKCYSIDIDNFLRKHLITQSHKFIGYSFLDRFEHIVEAKEFNDTLTTKDLIDLTGFNSYQIKKLRNEVTYVKNENKRYPINSKGRYQYTYNKDSLLSYIDKYQIITKPIKKYIFSKQFFSPKEVQKYINDNYHIKKSMSTIYRRILVTKEIPAIRIGVMLKIPILEFSQLDLKRIFNI